MNMDTREVSMPTPRAISASSTAARTMAPMRVFSMVSHNASPIAAAIEIMKMRYTGRREIQMIAAPDIERELLEEECKADGEQDLAQRVESERAQEYPLHQHADCRQHQRGNRKGEQPRSRGPDHRKRNVAAEQEI